MILLPLRYKALIEKGDANLQANLSNIIHRFSQILERNDVYFFRDYTDHGVDHINSVLRSSDNLICQETFDILEPKDIFISVFSVILHDLGLHISPEGFKSLLDGTWDDKRIAALDQKTWLEEWNDFIDLARKYTDQQKINIWGTSEIVIKNPDFKNLSEIDKKLVGEFIRRHHPRLAHEIALNGFPNDGKENILTIGLDKKLSELSGLIARSHGMDVRSCYDYLKDKYSASWKKPFNIKVIFWMVILRIADYIQIERDRAPKILLNIKSFSSPFSQAEWQQHNSIDFVDPETDDPELLNVHATPENPIAFKKLDTLLRDIQRELDLSWAVLGETYGAVYKMRYRRLTSNIYDIEKFSKSVDYIPFPVKFKTDPSLLSLLIEPLYNNEAGVGVRELLQNALDACFEREFLEQAGSGYKKNILMKLTGDEQEIHFTIIDNGVGMSLETLTNFYFNSGRSYRNSAEWSNLYAGLQGSKVLRTGRFGIGALSSFLLGDEVEVRTRTKDAPYGLSFTFNPSDESIEINKDYTAAIGTKIRIKIKSQIRERILEILEDSKNSRLNWFGHYVNDNDYINLELSEWLAEAYNFPGNTELLPAVHQHQNWRALQLPEIKAYFSYPPSDNSKSSSRAKGRLIHNGFEIKNGFDIGSNDFYWDLPTVYIEDRNGAVMLSLDRNSIYNDQLPFQSELITSLAYGLIEAIEDMDFFLQGDLKHCLPKKLPFAPHIDIAKNIICFKDHYTFNFPFIMEKIGCRSIYGIMIKGVDARFNHIFYNDSAYKLIHKGWELDNWFSIENGQKKFKSLLSSSLVFIDSIHKQSKNEVKKTRKSVVDPEVAKRTYEERIKNDKSLVHDNNIKLEESNGEGAVDEIVRSDFLTDTDWKIPILMEIFEAYYQGDYLIPYDRSKRRGNS